MGVHTTQLAVNC